MAATTETRRIQIKVDAAGVKEALDNISKSMGNMNKNVSSIARGFNLLKNAFAGYIGALGIRELAAMSDEMQNLRNRLKLTAGANEDVSETMARLLDLANETHKSIADVASVYSRMATALKGAGASSEELLTLTQTLINSFRISGATSEETTATIVQLSQAFSRGTLRGQELNSVLAQNATLSLALRQRYGSDLFKKAEEGAISVTEVLKILRDQQENINESAKKLTPTFADVISRGYNKLTFAIGQLNEQFQLAAKFSKGVDAVIENLSRLQIPILFLASAAIPLLITQVTALGASFVAFATKNPMTLLLYGLVVALTATTSSVGEFIDNLRNLAAWFVFLDAKMREFAFNIEKAVLKPLYRLGILQKEILNSLATDLDKINGLKALADDLGTPKYKTADDKSKQLTDAAAAFDSLIAKQEKAAKSAEKLAKVKDILGEINKEYLKGSIGIDQYNAKLVNFQIYKLNREFKEGKFDIFEYNRRLGELEIQNLNRDLKDGLITLNAYNDAVSNIKIKELNEQLNAGRISLEQYDQALLKVQADAGGIAGGAAKYIESVGTISQNVASAIQQTFGHLEDAFVDFTKRGKFNFKNFAQAVLDDLTRIIIRAQIIAPIAQGLLSYAGGGAGTSAGGSYTNYSGYAAKGMAFDTGSVRKFAKGGIVNSPTNFTYGSGSRGLMGEAGPEAIMPLARTSNGKLGVEASVTPVTINIINQTNSDVAQEEKTGPGGEKIIDVLITAKVKEGISSGKFDGALKSSFGLNRRGS